MKIYIICPVRLQTTEEEKIIERYVENLENKGHEVFYPKRDLNQKDETGYNIIKIEKQKMIECDRVDVMWQVNSKGSHFDLGMAFYANKEIKFVHLFQEDNLGKSYYKAINEYINNKEEKEINSIKQYPLGII